MALGEILGSGASRLKLNEMADGLRESFSVCLPPLLRRWLMPSERHLLVIPDGERAELFLANGEDRQLTGELERNAKTSLQAEVSITPKTLADYPCMLQLSATEVLTRKVSFPSQVRDSLDRVMGFEIDRLSPFESAEVLFDYRIDNGPARGGRLHVDLALCRRDHVEGWLERLRHAGAPAARVAWEGSWSKANLLPPRDRPRRHYQLFSLNRLLLLLLILLGTIAMATPLWQKAKVQEQLDAQLRHARTEAIAVDEVRQALEQARRGSVEVLKRKFEQPLMIELLKELTERLPDDTWVQTLSFDKGEVQMRGESSQATALIAQLEQAPGFSGVNFRSPVTPDARTGKERFNIAFQYARPKLQ